MKEVQRIPENMESPLRMNLDRKGLSKRFEQ